MSKSILYFVLKLIAAVFGLFIVTFVIYFFNLDMKATSLIEPVFLKHYEKIPRKQYV
ncbi:MAG: hypothetical protein IJJ50_01085 [Lachnospiraceae bacterium]|nr:hypothetical protein [Lachnospiraceae bacterium]